MSKKRIIIVDIDGTISNHSWRVRRFLRHSHISQVPECYNTYHKYSMLDKPRLFIWLMIRILGLLYKADLVYMTRRPMKWKAETEYWLDRLPFSTNTSHLIMARNDEVSTAAEYKRNRLSKLISKDYNIVLAIDDEVDNIKMMKALNIRTIKV